ATGGGLEMNLARPGGTPPEADCWWRACGGADLNVDLGEWLSGQEPTHCPSRNPAAMGSLYGPRTADGGRLRRCIRPRWCRERRSRVGGMLERRRDTPMRFRSTGFEVLTLSF